MHSRYIRIIFVFFVSIALIFSAAACGNQSAGTAEDAASEPLNIKIVGASPTGTIYMLLTGITECVNKSFPGSSVLLVPGGPVPNIYQVNNNEVDAGITISLMTRSASEGIEPYEEPQNNIAGVASFYSTGVQLVASKELGVTSLKEVIDNKMKISLSIDQPGSSASITFKRLLAEYGVTIEDFEGWGGKILLSNMNDSASMLAEGSIDGFCIASLYPTPPIQETAVNKDLVFLEIEPEVIKKLTEKYGYNEMIIPAGTYDFQEKDYATVASRTVLIVPKNSSDEAAYKLVASIHENLEYLRSVHVAMKNLSLDEMSSNIGIPLHPGAEKYYQEQKK